METFKVGDVVKVAGEPVDEKKEEWEDAVDMLGKNALGIVYDVSRPGEKTILYGVQVFRSNKDVSHLHTLYSSENRKKIAPFVAETNRNNCWWVRSGALEKFDFEKEGKKLRLQLCQNDGEEKYACIGDRVFVPQYELKGTVVAIRNVNCNETPDYYYGIRFDNVKYPKGLILNPLLGLLDKNDNSGKWLPKEYFSVIHRISILTGDKEPIAPRKTITCEEEILKKIRKLFTI